MAITYRDNSSEFTPIGFFTPHEELNTIKTKVTSHKDFKTLDDCIFAQSKFNLTEVYSDFPELRSKIGSNGRERRLTTSIFSFSELFSDKPFEGSIRIIGLIGSNKRCDKYIAKKYLDERGSNLRGFKVILPKSNGSGAIGEVLSTPLVGEPLVGYTQSFISFCNFGTRSEAEALLKYLKSKFARTLLGVLKITQDNNKGTWAFVPCQDFTSASDIDWNRSIAEIDKQLYAKYGLSPEEIDFIETRVKEME